MSVFVVNSNENTYPKGRALMQMYLVVPLSKRGNLLKEKTNPFIVCNFTTLKFKTYPNILKYLEFFAPLACYHTKYLHRRRTNISIDSIS